MRRLSRWAAGSGRYRWHMLVLQVAGGILLAVFVLFVVLPLLAGLLKLWAGRGR
jgi:hypothetical protein